MARYTRSPGTAKDAWLWSGLRAAIRPGVQGGGQLAHELRGGLLTYTEIGSQSREVSQGPELIGSALVVDTSRYFRRYPITITYPWTFSAWTYDYVYTNYADICTLSDTAGNNWMLFTVESTAAGQRLDWRRFVGGFTNVTSSGQVGLKRWNHFALVIKSTTDAAGWLNGSRVFTSSSSIMAANLVTTIGVGRFQFGTTVSGTHDNGRLGEFLEYDRALSPAEIGALSFGKSPFNARPGARLSNVPVAPASPWLYGRRTTVAAPYLAVA